MSAPTSACATIRARGRSLSARAVRLDAHITAAAPSEICEEFPAVCTAVGVIAFSPPSASLLVSRRPSSRSTSRHMPWPASCPSPVVGTCTAKVSRLKRSSAQARPARSCEAARAGPCAPGSARGAGRCASASSTPPPTTTPRSSRPPTLSTSPATPPPPGFRWWRPPLLPRRQPRPTGDRPHLQRHRRHPPRHPPRGRAPPPPLPLAQRREGTPCDLDLTPRVRLPVTGYGRVGCAFACPAGV